MLSNKFYTDFSGVCDRLRCNPKDLLAVLYSESGLNAAAYNPAGPAGGINQFMAVSLKEVGFYGTVQDFVKLSPEAQLTYVEKYFTTWKSFLVTGGMIYLANFLPAYLSIANAARLRGEDYVLSRSGAPGYSGIVYRINSVLDRNKDMAITLGDLESLVQTVQASQGFQSAWSQYLTANGQSVPLDTSDLPSLLTGATAWNSAEGVLQTQLALNKLGSQLSPDGVLGPRTTGDVRAFQISHGLKADGVPGPLTRKALATAISQK